MRLGSVSSRQILCDRTAAAEPHAATPSWRVENRGTPDNRLSNEPMLGGLLDAYGCPERCDGSRTPGLDDAEHQRGTDQGDDDRDCRNDSVETQYPGNDRRHEETGQAVEAGHHP